VTRVELEYGPVGEWYFEHPQPLGVPYGFDDYRRLLALVQSIAEVLEQQQLLFAQIVRFHHPAWAPHDLDRPIPEGTGAPHLAHTCEVLLAEARPGPFRLPAVTDVIGNGLIMDPSRGPQRFPDVMRVSATMYGNLAVNLTTQLDAWMEYTIDARAQPEVHSLNAPRLEAALVEIQRRTGIAPVTEATRFAVPEQTGLRNQRYDDGQPVDCSILLTHPDPG
jgi:hypothetical protein